MPVQDVNLRDIVWVQVPSGFDGVAFSADCRVLEKTKSGGIKRKKGDTHDMSAAVAAMFVKRAY